MDTRLNATHAALYGHDYLRDLVRDPLWYEKFDRFAVVRSVGAAAAGAYVGDALGSVASKNPSLGGPILAAAAASKKRLVTMMAELLAEGAVALGTPGESYDWDGERAPETDRLVIHHSSRKEGISNDELDALELIRLYVPAYANPVPDDVPKVKGKPIYSGHFRGGRQHFWPYHWMIRQDGSSERLLEDKEWGWHAGDLGMNRRSIALCFDADLSHTGPNAAMLAEARRVIHDNYAWMTLTPETLLGHSEVSKIPTECPGDRFADWKSRLL